MTEYRDTPQEFATPTEAELRARTKRNWALAAALLTFMVTVFFVMIARAGYL